jgi:hypothetical protein
VSGVQKGRGTALRVRRSIALKIWNDFVDRWNGTDDSQ